MSARQSAEKDAPLYEWDIEVRRLDHYGQRVETRTPAKVLASTKAEVTTKVRAMFDATYDDFRKFWSHTWALNSVQEVQRPIPPAKEDEDEECCDQPGDRFCARDIPPATTEGGGA